MGASSDTLSFDGSEKAAALGPTDMLDTRWVLYS
jgi:hypothetical protein